MILTLALFGVPFFLMWYSRSHWIAILPDDLCTENSFLIKNLSYCHTVSYLKERFDTMIAVSLILLLSSLLMQIAIKKNLGLKSILIMGKSLSSFNPTNPPLAVKMFPTLFLLVLILEHNMNIYIFHTSTHHLYFVPFLLQLLNIPVTLWIAFSFWKANKTATREAGA